MKKLFFNLLTSTQLWAIAHRRKTLAEQISTFFVPENKNTKDAVWDNAARMLLEDLITIVRNDGGSMSDILHIIRQFTLEELSNLLTLHKAPSCKIILPGNAAQSESVRFTLISHLLPPEHQ